MESKALVLWLLLVILFKYSFHQNICPKYDVLKPCYCHSRTESPEYCNNNGSRNSYYCQIPVITCAGDQDFNLSELFFKVNQSITEDMNRHFEWLYLSNSAITTLEANTLWGLKFRNIYIRQSLNLQTINPKAFRNSSQFVTNIWINATKLSDKVVDKRNVFKALNSLTNLKTLEVMSSRFTSIPSMAFDEYSSLRGISFHNYKERQYLKRINSKAFFKLSDLRRIDFRNNRISRINSFAFSFETESNHTLRIHLENNYLKSKSFSPKAFLGSNGRRVVLHLGSYNQCNTELKVLQKEVFEPFLIENKRNVIELYGCPIECDGSALWMERRKKLLNKRIRHIRCVPTIDLKKVDNFKLKETNKSIDEMKNFFKTNTSNDEFVKKITKRRQKLKRNPKKKFSLDLEIETQKPRMTLKRRLGLES